MSAPLTPPVAASMAGTFGKARDTRSARPPGAGRIVSIEMLDGRSPVQRTWPATAPVRPVQGGTGASVAEVELFDGGDGASQPDRITTKRIALPMRTGVPEETLCRQAEVRPPRLGDYVRLPSAVSAGSFAYMTGSSASVDCGSSAPNHLRSMIQINSPHSLPAGSWHSMQATPGLSSAMAAFFEPIIRPA